MSEVHEEQKIEREQFKIVVVGPPSSGKSSIILNIVGKEFNPDIKSTNCYEIHIKKIQIENRDCEVRFWDCSAYHYQSYSSVKKAFYRGAHCAFIVVDISQYDDTLIQSIEEWKNECFESEVYAVFVIGNKLDEYKEDTLTQRLEENDSSHIQLSSSRIVDQMSPTLRKELKLLQMDIEKKGYRIYFGSAKEQMKGAEQYRSLLIRLLKESVNNTSQIMSRFESDRNQQIKNKMFKDSEVKSDASQIDSLPEKEKKRCQLI